MDEAREDRESVSDWSAHTEAGIEAHSKLKYTEAELQFAAALRMAEKWAGAESLAALEKAEQDEVYDRLAKSLNNMAALYHSQGKYKMAEDLYNRCLEIKMKLYGEDHLEVALNLHNLAAVHSAKGRWAMAEPLYQRSLELREKALGADHHDLVPILKNYALMLRRAKRDEEAELMEARAKHLSQPI
jgi:tetratricopeptide (TPR) repeat protein